MKYLFFTLLFTFLGTTLMAQDTLYVRGKRKPLLVNITIVKEKSLNYTKMQGGFIYSIKLKDVKKIRFQKTEELESNTQYSDNSSTSKNNSSRSRKKPIYSEFDEFSSTISLNSIGSVRYYGGINYLRHIPSLGVKSSRHHFFVNSGGGFYNRVIGLGITRSSSINKARGFFLEFGMRMEVSSPRDPSNRFHIGLDANHRWVKKTTFNFILSSPEISNENEFSIQVPVGYTYRSADGFYFTAGLEVTTEKPFPLIHIGLGLAF